MEPLCLSVGCPNPSLAKRLPLAAEGMIAGTLGGVPTLVVAFRDPSPAEVEAVRSGELELGLLPLEPWGYVWLLRVGSIVAFDATYSPMVDRPGGRELAPAMREGEWRQAQVHAVEADSGIVRAIRGLGLPPVFSAALGAFHDMARAHADSFGRARWETLCQDHETRFPHPVLAFPHAFARCLIPPAGSLGA